MSKLKAVLFCVVSFLTLHVAPEASQALTDQDREELRAEQRALFDQIFENPSDIELMMRYATVSIQLQDYEAAISTLERLLIYEQDLPRVRLELGVAYFNLGSYAVAELYLNQVLDDPDTPDEIRGRVEQYMAEIERRTEQSTFSLVANLGLTYATNANLGPLDNEVTVGGQPGFIIDPSSEAQDDFGVRTFIYGSHDFDLEKPNDDSWLTDFSLFSLNYFEVTQGDTFYGRLRTGPRLALTEEASGAKLRPYVEGAYLNGDSETIYFAGFGGAQLTSYLGDCWSAFGDANVGYFDFAEKRDLEDRASYRLVAGGACQPDRDLVGRLAGIIEHYDAATAYNSSIEFGGRLSGEYRYDSGIEMVDRKWAITGYLDGRYRQFNDPDPFIDPNTTRDEFDLRGGVSHLFAIKDGFGVQLDVDGFLRDANIQNYDLNNLSITLSAQYRL